MFHSVLASYFLINQYLYIYYSPYGSIPFPTNNCIIDFCFESLKVTQLANIMPNFASTFAKIQLQNCIQIALLYHVH
jgi:hypothetical protein